MLFKKTKIKDVYIIELEEKVDDRGYNARVYSLDQIRKYAKDFSIEQINRVMTLRKGIIRGIHMQKDPMSEDKLVQCIKGSIFDVVVDLRRDSKTYGESIGEEISSENNKMILLPKGCAHGFQTLKNNTIVQYAVSQCYSPSHELGLRWNDPMLKIEWPIKKLIVSKKDASWPNFPL